MNQSNNIIKETNKYKYKWRIFLSITALCIQCFGIYYLYESVMLEAEFDVLIALSLILMGTVFLISYNYFRLILTNISLTQQGILFKREIVFDNTLKLIKYDDGSYILYSDKRKIRITKDIERSMDLIEKLKLNCPEIS